MELILLILTWFPLNSNPNFWSYDIFIANIKGTNSWMHKWPHNIEEGNQILCLGFSVQLFLVFGVKPDIIIPERESENAKCRPRQEQDKGGDPFSFLQNEPILWIFSLDWGLLAAIISLIHTIKTYIFFSVSHFTRR